MDKLNPLLAKPRSQQLYEQFPRCTANSMFPVEAIQSQAGQIQVQLRISPCSFLWMKIQDVDLITAPLVAW